MLSRSPLASCSFSNDQGTNIHVCYQDVSGNIGQIFYDDRHGWRPGTNDVVGRADLNTGIAMIAWDEGNEERVYYISDSKLVERCHSKGKQGWYNGSLTGLFTVAHYSQLAAIVFYHEQLFIQVYYQGSENVICMAGKNGEDPWRKLDLIGTAIAGSSIGASRSPGAGQQNVRLFFQRTDTQLVEFLVYNKPGEHEWKKGSFKPQLLYNPGAYIACVSYGKGIDWVFTVDRDNKFCVTQSIVGTEDWQETKQLTTVIPHSRLAAVLVPGSVPRARVYLQVAPGQIAEWGTDDWGNYLPMRAELPGTVTALAPGNVPWVRVFVQVGSGQTAEHITHDGIGFSATATQLSQI